MNQPSPSSAVLVFGRSPVPGMVKTRMIPEIGASAAASVYRQMLFGTLDAATTLTEARCELWLDDAPVDQALQRYARSNHIMLATQQGDDLGLRMHHALEQTLRTSDRAVLIGSDCPGIDAAYLREAFRALQRHQAVIGPASDGGYVLIGLNHPAPSLFSKLPWSTDQVLDQTRRRLRALQWAWHELPLRHDVDHVSDLVSYPRLAALAHSATGHGT